LERAACIVRGEAASLNTYTDKDVQKFAEFWNTNKRAAFNPAPTTH
jgi:hypothetical protein